MQNLILRRYLNSSLRINSNIQCLKKCLTTHQNPIDPYKQKPTNDLMRSMTNKRTSYASTVSDFHLIPDPIGTIIGAYFILFLSMSVSTYFVNLFQRIILSNDNRRQKRVSLIQNGLRLSTSRNQFEFR